MLVLSHASSLSSLPSKFCSDTKDFHRTTGCCPGSTPSGSGHPGVRFAGSTFRGYQCASEKDSPIFDKLSVEGADNIEFWANPDSGPTADVNAAQLSSLHESKYNLRTSNCPAHTLAYAWLTGQTQLSIDDALNIDDSPDVCDPNLMAFSKIVDKSYDMEYAVNVRSSLRNMSIDGVNLGPSRLPCYMWQGNPLDNGVSFGKRRLALNCDGPNLQTQRWEGKARIKISDVYATIPEIVNEDAIKAQMNAIVKGPDVDAYSPKNKRVVQLLQGLGWQHLSFAFKEAYEAFSTAFTSDTFCVAYTGPSLPNSTIGPYEIPPLPGTVCISANKSKETNWLQDPSKIYNNNFFMTSFGSSGISSVMAAKRLGFGGAGAAQRSFDHKVCPSEVASISPHECPMFEAYKDEVYKSIYYGNAWSFKMNPSVGLNATEWDSTAETYIKPKHISVMERATAKLAEGGKVFRYERVGRHNEAVFPEGMPLSSFAVFSPQSDVIKEVIKQVGENGTIKTNNDGSAGDIAYLQWDHVFEGPNKGNLRYIPSLYTDNKNGFYFSNGVNNPSTEIDTNTLPPALNRVLDGNGNQEDRKMAAELIDWTQNVGNQWASGLLAYSFFKQAGAVVTFNEGVMKVKMALIPLYNEYKDDPSYQPGL